MSNLKVNASCKTHLLHSFILLIACQATIAQKPHLQFKPASPVIIVGTNQFAQGTSFTVGNFTANIYRAPGTHALIQTTYIYNYGDHYSDTDVVYFDREQKPAYLRSIEYNTSSVPIRAIEEIRGNNIISQGYKWNNLPGNQSAYTFNSTKLKYELGTYTAGYTPALAIPHSTYNYDPVSDIAWKQKINDIFAKNNYSETINDNSYGTGGTATYIYKPFDNFNNVETETIQYKNANGTLREEIYREYYKDGYMYEEITYYDCFGKPIHFDSSVYDDYDYEVEYTEIEFKNGEPVAGYQDIMDEDEEGYFEYRKYYNPQTDFFERNPRGAGAEAAFMHYVFGGPSHDPCDSFPKNLVTINFSWLREDSKPAINLYGGYANYTRMLTPKIGVTAELGYNTGSMNNTKYSKLMYMGGLTYVPFNCAALNDNYTVSFHALAGMVNLKAKYGMYENSESYFQLMAGPRFDYNIARQLAVGVQADVNPVFPKNGGNTSLNYRFSLGARFEF